MKHKKLVFAGVMTAVAAALQIFESMIPVPVPVPGGKLGAANIVTMVVMSLYGVNTAFAVAVMRSVLGCLLYGGANALLYSVSGAVCSAAVCAVMYKCGGKFTFIGIGAAAALAHNAAQVAAAAAVLGNGAVFAYYPVLMLISVPCGIFTGAAAQYVVNSRALMRNI